MAEVFSACIFGYAFKGLRVMAKGICMCFYGSTITRDSKFLKRDEAINYRRKDSGERKNGLENVLFSIRERLTMKDAFHHIPCGISIRLWFNKFSIRTDHLFRLLTVLIFSKQACS